VLVPSEKFVKTFDNFLNYFMNKPRNLTSSMEVMIALCYWCSAVFSGHVSVCQIRDYEWCHPGNRRLKFNVIVTTYEIVLKDKVLSVFILYCKTVLSINAFGWQKKIHSSSFAKSGL